MTSSRTSSGIYLLDITMRIFPSRTSLISCTVFLWHTYPWLVMFSGKHIQRMSMGRKNVFIIRPENGAEWRNAALRPTGQRSSSLSWTVDLEISEFGETQLPQLQLDANTLLPCKTSRSVWNYVKTQHTSSIYKSVILTFTSPSTCSCSYLCGWQSVRSKWRPGATKSWAHCGSRGAVYECECTKGTQDNKPLESLTPAKTQSMCKYLWRCLLFVSWRTLLAVLKSGHQWLCPVET